MNEPSSSLKGICQYIEQDLIYRIVIYTHIPPLLLHCSIMQIRLPYLTHPSTKTTPSACSTDSGPPKSSNAIGDTGVTSRRNTRVVLTCGCQPARGEILCIPAKDLHHGFPIKQQYNSGSNIVKPFSVQWMGERNTSPFRGI